MFKTCPSCGDEFVEHVEECPDCRVPLVAPGDAPTASAASDSAKPGSIEDAVMLRNGDASELRQLAEALTAVGIACAIDTDPPGRGLGAASSARRSARSEADVRLALYVDARDRAAALSVLTQWLEASIPDSASARPSGTIDACPGCDEPLPLGAAACPSCGLEFPDLQVACPQCGQAVIPEAEHCPGCGYRP